MRCKNCGWVNPDGVTACEKCHAQLIEQVQHNSTEPNTGRMRSTVAESYIFDDAPNKSVPLTCPKCGYPIAANFTVCPNCNCELEINSTQTQSIMCKHCGANIGNDAKFCPQCGTPTNDVIQISHRLQRSSMGTIMSGLASGGQVNVFCTLKPIAWQGEDIPYTPISYSGKSIVLSRANTDANNNSITSKEQAVLSYENGNWYIENRSALHTTYLRVNGKIKLTSGDIIVLGNREFEFKG
jgi:uncharacterized OB-fold protein